jgi:hypothetical protein
VSPRALPQTAPCPRLTLEMRDLVWLPKGSSLRLPIDKVGWRRRLLRRAIPQAGFPQDRNTIRIGRRERSKKNRTRKAEKAYRLRLSNFDP